jgi:hypothetical protein
MLAAVKNDEDGVLLYERDAAALLKLSVRTLQGWRSRAFGPDFVRAGRAVRYRRNDVLNWINANVVAAEGDRRGRQ